MTATVISMSGTAMVAAAAAVLAPLCLVNVQ